MTRRRRLRGAGAAQPAALVTALVTVLVGAAATLAPPASAAGCSSARGVTVVVDFNQLGGGVQLTCDPSGGGDSAASLFNSNGYPLTYAQRQPGFVCRVSGAPASDPCVNTSPSNAFWALYWSDGESGRWVYSSLGATSLRVPDGGYVAFSWKQGAAAAPPSASPTAHAPSGPAGGPAAGADDGPANKPDGGTSAGPTSRPGDRPTASGRPTQAPSPDGAAASLSPGPTSGSSEPAPARGRDRPGKPGAAKGSGDDGRPGPDTTPSGSATAAPDAEVTDPEVEGDDAAPTASPPEASGAGLPGWVAPGLIAVLFGAAGAAMLVRRRGAPGP